MTTEVGPAAYSSHCASAGLPENARGTTVDRGSQGQDQEVVQVLAESGRRGWW